MAEFIYFLLENIIPLDTAAAVLRSKRRAGDFNSMQSTVPTSESYDIKFVATVIWEFVLETYHPFLLSAKQNKRHDSPNANRVRISTLFAIREMLILNAEKLFIVAHLKQSPTGSRVKESICSPHSFANVIIRNTAKRFHARHPESHFYDDFVQAIRSCGGKSKDLSLSLTQADVLSTHAHPDERKVG